MTKRKSFMLIIISMLCLAAGCFAFANNITTPYAAEEVMQECFYLVGQNGGFYEADEAVGSIDGVGKFIVGASDVTLTAKSYANYKIIGWQVIYTEQSNKTEFIDSSYLVDWSKQVYLTAKDGTTKIKTTVKYNQVNNVMTTSMFTLDNVFEDLIVRPIFDHVYYSVDITELAMLAKVNNSLKIGSHTLFYDTSIEDGGLTIYTNAYIKISESFYYYGTLYFNDGKYYTLHKALSEGEEDQQISYLDGAFRVGDEVDLKFEVDIKSEIKDSKNIDLVGASVLGATTTDLNKSSETTLDVGSYKIEQDSYLRTTSMELSFNIVQSNNQNNVIDLKYHNLYVVDLSIVIDGSTEHSETEDVFGTKDIKAAEIISNISIYNFYTMTSADCLQFLVKNSEDNYSRPFGLSCSQRILQLVDGAYYVYYNFSQINGVNKNSEYFATIDQNMTVSIDYTSAMYSIDFVAAEHIDGEDELKVFEGNVIETLQKKRGEKVNLTLESAEDVVNVGYTFKGYALSLNGDISETLTEAISKDKPQNMLIYMCFEKNEYKISFKNFNTEKIGEYIALSSVSFVVSNGIKADSHTLYASDLILAQTNMLDSIELECTVKLGDTLSIFHVVNLGFNILGYSLKDPGEVTEDDYFTSLTFTAEFITENNLIDVVEIYIYEEIIKYQLTYFIEAKEDNKLGEDVIMASIDAQCAGATIEKFDLEDKLISEQNGNLANPVAKIIVSNLQLNDEVLLTSKGHSVGTGEEAYNYVFNWFTADGKSTLAYEENAGVYSHTEKINRITEIKVVYSMPSTKVIISVEEELAANENFNFSFDVSGENVEQDIENPNAFIVTVGVNIKVSVSDIAFGYTFNGYTYFELNETKKVNALEFTCEVLYNGTNTIILNFTRDEYRFIFSQYGAGLNGDKVNFDGDKYCVLDVDNTEILITKPVIGYYVSSVSFNEVHNEYSSVLRETNDFRLSEDIEHYLFKMTREDFISVVTNYSLTTADAKEVYVRLDYAIFTYQIKVQYGITNPKNDVRDSYVRFPEICLQYEWEGETDFANITYDEVATLVFVGIPYNAKSTLNLTGTATAGLSLSGWRYLNGMSIDTADYVHSFEYLTVSNTTEDLEFAYKLTYVAYDLKINYDSSMGDPKTYINGKEITTTSKQITVYDQLVIEANALRNKGFEFDKITYKKPQYTEFIYSEEAWNSRYSELYFTYGEGYKLNADPVYDSSKTYYIYTELVQEWSSSDIFRDEMFLISNYAFESDGRTLVFNVEYKMIELSIVNEITQTAPNVRFPWSMTDKGSGSGRLEMDISELANIFITANDKEEDRPILEGDSVYYYDTVTISVIINKNAINFDGAAYDLSMGLSLKSVKISIPGYTSTVAVKEVAHREYEFTFYVGEFMPPTGQEIKITYQLLIESQAISVTTIVTNSEVFYKNIKLYIDSAAYGFDASYVVSENDASVLNHNSQFLAKADIYAKFKSSSTDYINNFIISGALIYFDGELINEEDYGKFGIVKQSFEDGNFFITARVMGDLDVKFIVQPKITYNGGPEFVKTFNCTNQGYGIEQTLSVGTTSSSDIQVAGMLVNAMAVKYISILPGSTEIDAVVNVGRYRVLISFVEIEGWDWLEEIIVADDVALIIQQRQINITYNPDAVVKTTKVYDGTSDYNPDGILKYLLITDDNLTLSINYVDIMNVMGSNLKLEEASAYISTLGKDAGISDANESMHYNLYVYNLAFKPSSFNNNFVLKNSDIIIYNYIQITRRQIKLHNVYLYNKVYDGTDLAEFVSTETITTSNTIAGDDVAIDYSKLNPRFENADVGTNKKVILDASGALVGRHIGNYYIDVIQTEGLTIYPYSLSINIKGAGKVSVLNIRGLTDKEMVGLIPLNAILIVEPIYPDSNEYVDIYGSIRHLIKGNNEFAMGYKISFLIDGKSEPVNNNLYLSLPGVKNVNGLYFLTGSRTGKVDYSWQSGNLLMDLKQIEDDINYVIITTPKLLLKVWQIILIVVGVLLIIFVIVLVLLIIRKKKINRDSVHDKI